MASSGLLVAVFLFQARIQCPFLFVLILCLSLMGGFLFESVPSCFRLLFIFIIFINKKKNLGWWNARTALEFSQCLMGLLGPACKGVQ
jgi:hypothetical protein